MIKCPECGKEYNVSDLDDSTYIIDVFDRDKVEAYVSVTLRCPDWDCNADIYEGDGKIALYSIGE